MLANSAVRDGEVVQDELEAVPARIALAVCAPQDLNIAQVEGVARVWAPFYEATAIVAAHTQGDYTIVVRTHHEVDAASIAQSLQQTLHDRLGVDIYVAYASFGSEHIHLHDLINAAQGAMLAKSLRPVEAAAPSKLAAIEMFRKACRARRVGCVAQPIVHLDSMQVVGYEQLARIHADSGDHIPTAVWIEHVIQSHHSLQLARIMADKAETFVHSKHNVYVAFNVTACDMMDNAMLHALLKRSEHYRRHVVLELTEWHAASNPDKLVCNIEQLRAHGYRVALDDFGNRYSSLPMLRSGCFDLIKLDLSLVHSSRGVDLKFVEVALECAEEIGARVVAEGLETEQLVHKMRDIGVQYGQGFYLDRLVAEQRC